MATDAGRRTSTVAVLNPAALTQWPPFAQHQDCLSIREAAIFHGTSNPRRRTEWLAGRLAAKYLFLCEPASPPSSNDLTLIQLAGDDLARFSPAEYREVEILRSTAAAGGPALGWRSGTPSPEPVAISHTAGKACAFLGAAPSFAVDMETRESRSAGFYQSNFTPRERSWAAFCSRSFHLDAAWVFTLLWSIKECLLKTVVFHHLSLWNMPALEVDIVSGTEALPAPHDAGEFRSPFVFLHAAATDGTRTAHPRVAVTGNRETVLTAIEE